ncbi:MAG: 23S rRNA (adenine(2503)-C(2))-methyltransferase RlmN [bacterium]|nr:23S rRNA (adenine(2503)-C(2))-methyltransferase RlmN [bacterium]
MYPENLSKILKTEPAFRFKQAKRLIFVDLIDSWQSATVFPLALRQKLDKECPLRINGQNFRDNKDQTDKALLTLTDGAKIETVLLRHQDKRRTVCVSCQVGCPLACAFCATGKMGFKRNLTASEIVAQVLFFARHLKKNKEKITNIVFMGMGEPFLNYDNVLDAIKILNDKGGFNLGARHFSISTSGIVEGIKKLAKEPMQINLAISLHAPNDALRSQLMPINKKYPLKEIMRTVRSYVEKTNRRVMFEYLMIKDFNDRDECAKELIQLMDNPLYFVNLIQYNRTGDFEPSTPEQIQRFKNILEKAGVTATQRYRFGADIKAACGQLAA